MSKVFCSGKPSHLLEPQARVFVEPDPHKVSARPVDPWLLGAGDGVGPAGPTEKKQADSTPEVVRPPGNWSPGF